MEEKFISKALEANLAETRYKDIDIPEEHRYFIGLSKKYYGLNRRASECLIEFSHPLSNRKFVVEELREILLNDFWFYVSLDDSEKAFGILCDIFEELLSPDTEKQLQILIVRTLLEFTELLAMNEKALQATISRVLLIFRNTVDDNEQSFIEASKYFFKHLSVAVRMPGFSVEIISIARDILLRSLRFWEETSMVEEWHENIQASLQYDYQEKIKSIGTPYFKEIANRLSKPGDWKALSNIPVYDEIADHFRAFTAKMDSFIDQFYYSFYLLHLPGMEHLRERIIWDINKLLRSAIDEVADENLPEFVDKIFRLSKELKIKHTSSVLDCLLTLGKKIIDRDKSEDRQLVEYFEERLIHFGFESPGIVYVDDNWQISVNENHIKNIRVWLELIEYPQTIMEKLLSALIVNLKVGGIFISDTDLFQRDISKILNSNIAPYYKKVKQLTKIFPVYFNEIGAEGDIRKVTTSMDEINKRQDRLIHFLRKQVHTESNNTLIDLSRKIFNFWFDADINKLRDLLPSDVYNSVDLQGPYFNPVHAMLKELCGKQLSNYQQVLEMDDEELFSMLKGLKSTNDTDVQRIMLLKQLYALLKEKYSFDTHNVIPILKRYPYLKTDDIDNLGVALEKNDLENSLSLIYGFMKKLKQIIFNPKASEGWENIYHKRHIAIGIPSMYGVYRENKFEALGLTFRLEKVATRLMERVVDRINLDYISAKTLNQINKILEFFREGLELDGISSQGFNSNLQMLKYSLSSRSFSLEQYVNIFQFIADDVKRTINKYFLKTYEYPLQAIIPQMFAKDVGDDDKALTSLINKKSEEFYRDILSSAFLMQPLDMLISKIISSLRRMVDNYSPGLLNDVMSYNADLVISPIHRATLSLDNQVFLGSKAYYLKKLFLSGFPVPEGFVLTTELFRRRNAIVNHPDISSEMDRMIQNHIQQLEDISGRKFGDHENPLLLSVRSGTAISMPGAMDTFLNVGMNDELANALGGKPDFGWTSWDSYRRLIQSWGMAHGINRDAFDKLMQDYKNKFHVDQKANFQPERMKQIALSYKQLLEDHGVSLEQDPFLQLKQAINHVLDSWSSKRARVYREHLQIADEWGTAVIVQRMIMGNLHKNSGTGVVFTQHPNMGGSAAHLYGDFTLCSQGEDIVAGLVHTMPVSEEQKRKLRLKSESLQTMMPDVFKKIEEVSEDMSENYGYGPQEIEFTFESSKPEDFYILQTRDLEITAQKSIPVFSSQQKKMQLIGHGIGIGGGAMNGILAFDMDDLITYKEKWPEEKLLLVRPDTVPDDIGMIFECDGLLTSRGGATSHAAVTAVRLGKVCIVNCSDLAVDEDKKQCIINKYILKSGDKIAIDGHLGNIYKGNYPIKEKEVLPSI